MNPPYFIYIYLFFISFLITYFIVPKVILFCNKNNIKESPESRKEHNYPMARLGGLSIFLGTTISIILLLLINYFFGNWYIDFNKLVGLNLCSLFIFLIGLIDDLYNLKAYPRLFGQIVVASLTYSLGVRIELIDLNLFSDTGAFLFLPEVLSFLLTLIWIVGVINAINWIDGIDGLATTIITLSALSFGFISITLNQYIPAIISVSILGPSIAFLRYNWFPAKIFMGDGGSYFLGFNIAIIAMIYRSFDPLLFNPFQVIFLLAIPLFDMVFVTFKRLIKKVSPFLPDRNHYHHRMLKLGINQKRIVLLSIIISLIFISIGMSISV